MKKSLGVALLLALWCVPAICKGEPEVEGLEADYHVNAKYSLSEGGTIYHLRPVGERRRGRIGDIVYWDGPVVGEAWETLRALLAEKSVEYVYLNGPGGHISFALRIGELIRRRQVTTVVQPGSACYSACALVYLAGSERIVASPSQGNPNIGFHSPYREKGEGIASVAPDSEVGNAICGYIQLMIGSEGSATKLCREMFAVKGNITYSLSALLENGIATETFKSWRDKRIQALPPLEEWPVEERLHYQCELAVNYMWDVGNSGGGLLESYNKHCGNRRLPARAPLISHAAEGIVPDQWPFDDPVNN